MLGPFKHVVLYLLLYRSLDFILLSFFTTTYWEERKQIILEYSLKGFLLVCLENLKWVNYFLLCVCLSTRGRKDNSQTFVLHVHHLCTSQFRKVLYDKKSLKNLVNSE